MREFPHLSLPVPAKIKATIVISIWATSFTLIFVMAIHILCALPKMYKQALNASVMTSIHRHQTQRKIARLLSCSTTFSILSYAAFVFMGLSSSIGMRLLHKNTPMPPRICSFGFASGLFAYYIGRLCTDLFFIFRLHITFQNHVHFRFNKFHVGCLILALVVYIIGIYGASVETVIPAIHKSFKGTGMECTFGEGSTVDLMNTFSAVSLAVDAIWSGFVLTLFLRPLCQMIAAQRGEFVHEDEIPQSYLRLFRIITKLSLLFIMTIVCEIGITTGFVLFSHNELPFSMTLLGMDGLLRAAALYLSFSFTDPVYTFVFENLCPFHGCCVRICFGCVVRTVHVGKYDFETTASPSTHLDEEWRPTNRDMFTETGVRTSLRGEWTKEIIVSASLEKDNDDASSHVVGSGMSSIQSSGGRYECSFLFDHEDD